MSRSEAPRLFHTLADTIGPRLSGSPGHIAATRDEPIPRRRSQPSK